MVEYPTKGKGERENTDVYPKYQMFFLLYEIE